MDDDITLLVLSSLVFFWGAYETAYLGFKKPEKLLERTHAALFRLIFGDNITLLIYIFIGVISGLSGIAFLLIAMFEYFI